MFKRILLPCLAGAVLLGVVAQTPAEQPAPRKKPPAKTPRPSEPKPDATVVRFVGVKQGTAWGRPCAILVVAPRTGAGQAELVIPNRDPKVLKVDPDPRVVELVKSLKSGDLLEITSNNFQGKTMLGSIKHYTPKPGEDDPDALEFVKTEEKQVGNKTLLLVTLQKSGKTQAIAVPLRKGEGGAEAPDEVLASQARRFTPGELVEVETQRTDQGLVLKSLERWSAPETAEVLKQEVKEIDNVKYPAVIVKGDAGEKTLVAPAQKLPNGKSVPEPTLAALVKGLQPGWTVAFKTRSEGDNDVLKRLRVVSREKPKPAHNPLGG